MQLVGDEDDRVYRHISAHHGFNDKIRIGVAVSGGSDSLALLNLLSVHASRNGAILEAATVDHGLRKEARDEADFVAKICAGLGVTHSILTWDGWNGQGNLQDQARKARYRLLADWATTRQLQVVALGHTMDDQAETFLMRLARKAGVDGLSSMASTFERDGMAFCRPVLALKRQELRSYLRRHDISWCDDPSNEDDNFDRIKARNALKEMSNLGIDADTLTGVAFNMSQAKGALDFSVRMAASNFIRQEIGDLVIVQGAFDKLPTEISRRLIILSLNWISSASYPPRRDAISSLARAIKTQRSFTLQGCQISISGNEIRLTREYDAVRNLSTQTGAIWDGRWRVSGPGESDLTVQALGNSGLTQVSDWRLAGLPRRSLMATPAIWKGKILISAPIAGYNNGWTASLAPNRADFAASILSH